MKYVGLYHLNAYTYADPTWFPDMDPALREMFARVTKGALSGNAGGPATEDFKINGQYVDTPVIDGKEGVVGIPFFDGYVEKAAIEFLDEAAQTPDTPFFINVNFMKVHQPNMPAPEFQQKSLVEVEVRRLGGRARHPHRPHHGQARRARPRPRTRWSSTPPTTAPGRTSTPTPATRRSAAPRARSARAATGFRRSPSGPARSRPDTKNHEIVGGLDLMATFASVAGVDAADQGPRGPADHLRQLRHDAGAGPAPARRRATSGSTSPRTSSRPAPPASANYKAVFNLRGDDGAATGGLAVDTNLGWKGAESYVATVPQIFDLWADPQERYDIFMNNFTERTWTMVTICDAIKKLMKTYVEYPPRKLQSQSYTGPITITNYERLQSVRDELAREGVNLPMPTGN